jgi:hypothetical protein
MPDYFGRSRGTLRKSSVFDLLNFGFSSEVVTFVGEFLHCFFFSLSLDLAGHGENEFCHSSEY